MKPFLEKVAKAYTAAEPEALHQTCFVFPNKRSATFFRHYLVENLTPPAVLPHTTTISALFADMSPLVEASRVDRLMILYNEYKKINKEVGPFDKFVFWGEMLLSDFDDVDRYLVDAKALFVNLKRFREIRSNYLTAEQLEIIGRYWEGVEDYTPDVEHFWQHTSDEKGRLSAKFVALWETLDELYSAYKTRLAEAGLTSPGGIYRNAVQVVKEQDKMPFERYVFVGFNVLSASEIAVFETLRDRGLADFYWDVPAERFHGSFTDVRGRKGYANKAMRFVARNAAIFPSRYPLEADEDVMPQVKIVNVPSYVGQAKLAGQQVGEWIEQKKVDPSNAVDTAIVLPDENLFVQTINSMPQKVTQLNVTMGYPLKRTPVATFMRAVVTMQLHGRKSGRVRMLFYEDVIDVLSHSVALTIDEDATRKLTENILRQRRFMISVKQIEDNYPTLAPIFSYEPPETSRDDEKPDDEQHLQDAQVDINAVAKYVGGLLDLIERSISGIANRYDRAVQRQFVEAYRRALGTITEAMKKHGIDATGTTIFQLIERLMASEAVNLKGEPLCGLQVMGVLETRALDFRNVVIMSMNERVFPRKSFSRSFIPEVLRRAYRMSTLEHQESIFAYYFYRLISRAERVTLLYDGRTVGVRQSELSRYAVQLLYTFRDKVNVSHINAVNSARSYKMRPVAVQKDARIMERLKLFLTPGSGYNLSASSINAYIDCPLGFYLRNVERIDTQEDVEDYINYSVYGKIVHRVAELLYLEASPTKTLPVEVTADHLNRWISADDDIVQRLTRRAIVEEYINENVRNKSAVVDDGVAFTGEMLVTQQIVTDTIKQMLRQEVEHAPFTIVGTEVPIKGQFELAPGLNVNVSQIIDRVDRVNGTLRIIDYKTGGDKAEAKGWEDVFDPTNPQRQKLLVQLWFYCHVYAATYPETEEIKPMLYSMRNIYKGGISAIKIEGTKVEDYRDYAEEFKERFSRVVSELFDPNVPFSQNPNPERDGHACRYCKFKTICSLE